MKVHLLERNADLEHRVHRLARKRLVDLVEVNIILGDTSFIQDFRDGVSRANTRRDEKKKMENVSKVVTL